MEPKYATVLRADVLEATDVAARLRDQLEYAEEYDELVGQATIMEALEKIIHLLELSE